MTRGRTVDVKLDRSTTYELDGGARHSVRALHATIEPGAVLVCVPEASRR
jgi:hypothetical protein